MTGRVRDRHALIPVTFPLPDGREIAIEFVIDTGFTDALCLPVLAIEALGLPYKFQYPARLAVGNAVLLPVYETEIIWDGARLGVHVMAAGDRPLLGTALLDGKELVVRFAEDDSVTVRNLR